MSAETTLHQLFPIELGGDFGKTLAISARILDAAQASADSLLTDSFADAAVALLPDWERVLGLDVGPDDPIAYRRDQVVRKIRERGGLSRAYFIRLAAALGYAIEIVEPRPSMAGIMRAGDTIISDAVRWQWGVVMPDRPVYQFRAGSSCAGERLLWWDSEPILEAIFRELKPAHTFVYFIY
jgi:uncharacterized protein YmfQ (DUF2313 family)